MKYLYVVAALVTGATLVGGALVAAVVYTPHAYSLLDTAVTALTGASLQVGNLFVVSALTAVFFDLLASTAGLDFSLLVPTAVGYLVFHAAMYRSSAAVTALQATPYDPRTTIPDAHWRALDYLTAGKRGATGRADADR